MPKLLDLFCGAGGASMGYHRAGFDVVGVDINPQPNYPFEFHEADALEYPLGGFDIIHASPPCQRYSVATKRNGRSDDWPDLVAPMRDRLESAGVPWVIENVPGSPLKDPITLCGATFKLRVYRHRLFESNRPISAPPHLKHTRLCYTLDKRKPHYGQLDEWTAFVQVTGGGNCSKASAADAMGINWPTTKHELNEAIPPAYTEHIGRQLIAHYD